MTSFPSSSGMVSALACGRSTSTPVWMSGADTMKMMSRTSITSTSGVTLISDIMPPEPPPVLIAMARSLSQEVALHDVEEVVRERVHLRRQHLHLAGEV